jgi:glucose/arabinose dehydrogenase
LLLTFAVSFLALGPARATILPPGFIEEDVVCLSPGDPAQLAFAPDGSLFIGAKYGKIWLWNAGVAREIAFLSVSQEIERGVNGLAVDPDYAANHYLWIYYTTAPPVRNRLSRFTFDGNALVSEVVMIDGPLVVNQNHNGGDIRFARDKTLFVAMGNDNQDATSQDPFELRGKILHIDRNGAAAPGNPFADGVGGDPRVWALGLRNPYRIAFEPGTDDLFIADVGWFQSEEIHRGIRGANYGWPAVEGSKPAGLTGYVYPIHDYDHGNGAAIIGGDFAKQGDLTLAYEGDYFFGDFVRRELYRMQRDARGNAAAVELWGTDFPRPSDIEFGPDGALYFVSFGGGGIPVGCVKRIRPDGGPNRQPIARPSASPDSGLAPLTVTLDGTASSDPDSDPLTHAWTPGDGAPLSGATVSHVYPAGVYQASLAVNDGHGGADTSPSVRIVSGNRRPLVTLTAPLATTHYSAGQTIAFSGSATDPEEGALPCSRFSWQVLRRHGAHSHPVLGPIEGSCSGSFTTLDHGDAAADEWYEVVATATDSGVPLGAAGALTKESAVALTPLTSSVTLETAPLGNLLVTVDGTSFTAPRTEPGVVSFVRTIGAPDDQPHDGRVYHFLGWSDAGAREHEIPMPPASATLVATFGCNVLAEVAGVRLSKGSGGKIDLSWSPVVDPCLTSGSTRYQVWVASTPRPTVPPGAFPDDPPFTLAGSSATEAFADPPSGGTRYYLVVGVGTDQRPGPSGY